MSKELLINLAVPVAFFAFFYFMVIRPQKKKETEVTTMRNELKVGDDIVTIGGIRGKVVVAKEDILVIESGVAKTKLEITRWAVSTEVD